MKIALRTGGGRGDYELAGRQRTTHVSDLFDRDITYEVTPDILLPGNSAVRDRNGKPRIRLYTPREDVHVYRLLASILLLPKPRRELSQTRSGPLQLRDDAFSIVEISVDISRLSRGAVTLRPTNLLLGNRDRQKFAISFPHRMAQVAALWTAARRQDSEIAQLVRQHEHAVRDLSDDHLAIEQAADALRDSLDWDGDLLDLIAVRLDLPPTNILGASEPADIDDDIPEDDDTSTVEARRREVRSWRNQAVRGYEGTNFRQSVRAAYHSTCLFSGLRLPRTDVTGSAGVDAAHILPWAQFEANSVSNGLCLSKLCHWAFDAGILRLDYVARRSAYTLRVPNEVRRLPERAPIDLDYFLDLQGDIDVNRLPANENHWPRPAFIRQLNRIIY